MLAFTGGTLDVTPAAAGYFNGRFTNGINAADVLNQDIEGTNAVGSLFGGDNYSYGGARAGADLDGLPDLEEQVSSYLGVVGGTADSNSLFLINVGGRE